MRICDQCGSEQRVIKVKIGFIYHPGFPNETADVTFYSADLCKNCRKVLKKDLTELIKEWRKKEGC
jgi:hypothetical protein